MQRWASAGGDFHPVALSYTWLVICRRERRAALRDWNDSTSLRPGWNFNTLKPESRAQCDTGSETRTALCRYTHALGYETKKKPKKNWQTHQTLNISMCLEPKTSALHWTPALLERLRNVKLRERNPKNKASFPQLVLLQSRAPCQTQSSQQEVSIGSNQIETNQRGGVFYTIGTSGQGGIYMLRFNQTEIIFYLCNKTEKLKEPDGFFFNSRTLL